MGKDSHNTTTVLVGVSDTKDVEVANTDGSLQISVGRASFVFWDTDVARELASLIVTAADKRDSDSLLDKTDTPVPNKDEGNPPYQRPQYTKEFGREAEQEGTEEAE